MPMWSEASRMQKRMEDTRRRVGSAYPHWADPETGAWTTSADGDRTGGLWAGMHWLASKYTGRGEIPHAGRRLGAGPQEPDCRRHGVQVVSALFRRRHRRDPL